MALHLHYVASALDSVDGVRAWAEPVQTARAHMPPKPLAER